MPKNNLLINSVHQDACFKEDPEITFFKNTYHRYSNFSMELIDVNPNESNTKLKVENKPLNLTFNIPRNGDLISHVYLKFTMPDIYSFETITNMVDKAKQFKWINRLGEYIIKETSFYIGKKKVNHLYSEWLHIWTELNLSMEKKEGYNRMIGNIEQFYNPGNTNYPGCSIIKDSSGSNTNDSVASIKTRDIIVPLPFWFTYNYGLSLPLINLQHEYCRIEIQLRPFNELYTIVDDDDDVRQKPTKTDHNLSKFLSATAPSGTLKYTSTIVTELEINPHLQINYIFLDNDERKVFAENQQDYLITDIQYHNQILNGNQTKHIINLDFNGPCSKLCWVLRRTDYSNNNQWYNFTNWPDKDINPIINTGSDFDVFTGTGTDNITINNYDSLKYKNICQEVRLLFNGQERFELKKHQMFNLINNYSHSKNIPEEGIYVYSFELLTDENNHQPTGICNFSNISNIQLELTLIERELTGSYNYELLVFAQTYNILKFISGVGNLEFSN